MAGFGHQVTTTVKVDGVVFSSTAKTYSSNAKFDCDETIPADTADVSIDTDFAVDHIISIAMISTKDVTVKTNSTGEPDDEFDLAAGVEFVWNTDRHEALIFTTDVTGLFISNADPVADARFKMTVLLDSTIVED